MGKILSVRYCCERQVAELPALIIGDVVPLLAASASGACPVQSQRLVLAPPLINDLHNRTLFERYGPTATTTYDVRHRWVTRQWVAGAMSMTYDTPPPPAPRVPWRGCVGLRDCTAGAHGCSTIAAPCPQCVSESLLLYLRQ